MNERLGLMAVRIAERFGWLSFVDSRVVGDYINKPPTFSKSTQKQLQLTSINDAVRDVVKLVKKSLSEAVEVSSELEERLPRIAADTDRLKEALLTLSLNAAKTISTSGTLKFRTHSVKGDILRSRFSDAVSSDYIVVEVSESGSLMSKTMQRRIFDPFFTTKRSSRGVGIGLATAFRIIKQHSGFLDLNRQFDRGTQISLYFPIQQTSTHWTKREVTHHVPRKLETVLLLEDELTMSELLTVLLEAQGYNVLTALSGNEATSIFQKHQSEIELVISDLGMPKLDAFELVKGLRQINPSVKFILASGHSTSEYKRFAEVADLILSSFSPDQLLKKIRDALDASKNEHS